MLDGVDVVIVLNLEFLCEGLVIDDFMYFDCIVFGVEYLCVIEIMKVIYVLLEVVGYFVFVIEIEMVEFVKYVVNVFFVVKISYIIEIFDLCEVVGVDVELVVNGMGFDWCIGVLFLKVGFGWGGLCFLKDMCVLKVMVF